MNKKYRFLNKRLGKSLIISLIIALVLLLCGALVNNLLFNNATTEQNANVVIEDVEIINHNNLLDSYDYSENIRMKCYSKNKKYIPINVSFFVSNDESNSDINYSKAKVHTDIGKIIYNTNNYNIGIAPIQLKEGESCKHNLIILIKLNKECSSEEELIEYVKNNTSIKLYG